MNQPTVLDVFDARRRLAPYLQPTPFLPSSWLSSIADGNVSLKIESLNLTRSFKVRGAMNAALKIMEGQGLSPRLSEGAKAPSLQARPTKSSSLQTLPTLVTASAGNHGRALALAAERLGLSCVVFTPAAAPETKQNAIRRHGAVLHADCDTYDIAEARAKALADAEGGVYISPYNHPDVIAGAGTVALEILESMPDFDRIVIPLGGGGLASGVGLAVKAGAPRATVVGVEVEASAPFTASLAAGHIAHITPRATLADGLTGNLEDDTMTFPIVQQVVDFIVTISEDELTRAMRGLATEEQLIVEGAGAAATAAVMAGKASAPGQRSVVLVTGGNVDVPKWLFAIA